MILGAQKFAVELPLPRPWPLKVRALVHAPEGRSLEAGNGDFQMLRSVPTTETM
jgi:hypothetical protein